MSASKSMMPTETKLQRKIQHGQRESRSDNSTVYSEAKSISSVHSSVQIMTAEAKFEERLKRKAMQGNDDKRFRHSMPPRRAVSARFDTKCTSGEPVTAEAKFEERLRRKAMQGQDNKSLRQSMPPRSAISGETSLCADESESRYVEVEAKFEERLQRKAMQGQDNKSLRHSMPPRRAMNVQPERPVCADDSESTSNATKFEELIKRKTMQGKDNKSESKSSIRNDGSMSNTAKFEQRLRRKAMQGQDSKQLRQSMPPIRAMSVQTETTSCANNSERSAEDKFDERLRRKAMQGRAVSASLHSSMPPRRALSDGIQNDLKKAKSCRTIAVLEQKIQAKLDQEKQDLPNSRLASSKSMNYTGLQSNASSFEPKRRVSRRSLLDEKLERRSSSMRMSMGSNDNSREDSFKNKLEKKKLEKKSEGKKKSSKKSKVRIRPDDSTREGEATKPQYTQATPDTFKKSLRKSGSTLRISPDDSPIQAEGTQPPSNPVNPDTFVDSWDELDVVLRQVQAMSLYEVK